MQHNGNWARNRSKWPSPPIPDYSSPWRAAGDANEILTENVTNRSQNYTLTDIDSACVELDDFMKARNIEPCGRDCVRISEKWSLDNAPPLNNAIQLGITGGLSELGLLSLSKNNTKRYVWAYDKAFDGVRNFLTSGSIL